MHVCACTSLLQANVSGKGQAAAAEPGKDLQPELLKAAARREGAAAQRSELELEPLKLVVQLMRTQSVLLDSISEHHKLGNGLKVRGRTGDLSRSGVLIA